MTAIAVINTLAPLPKASAYTCTNGWGAPRENNVSKSGRQNKNRIIKMNPKTPERMVPLSMPFAAMTLAFLVSSATWPDASKPISTLAVKKLYYILVMIPTRAVNEFIQ